MHLLVYDSGIGGLGVVREIRRQQPDAHVSYLADNAFFPYGEKPDAELVPRIVALVSEAIVDLAPHAVVVACNTASTIALNQLRGRHNTPFIGCVPPVKPAAAASRTGHVGVLATPATIKRPYLTELVDQFARHCTVHRLGTPELVVLAEEKFRARQVCPAKVIAPLFERPGGELIDTVALGCTHFNLLLPEMSALYPHVTWFDPAEAVARHTCTVTRFLPPGGHGGPGTAYFTGALPDHELMAARLEEYGFSRIVEGYAPAVPPQARARAAGQHSAA